MNLLNYSKKLILILLGLCMYLCTLSAQTLTITNGTTMGCRGQSMAIQLVASNIGNLPDGTHRIFWGPNQTNFFINLFAGNGSVTFNTSGLAAGSMDFTIALDPIARAPFTMNDLPPNPPQPNTNSPQCFSNGVLLDSPGAPEAGIQWYWQSTANGTSTAEPAMLLKHVYTSGVYYMRALGEITGCWSQRSSNRTVVVFNNPTANFTTNNDSQCLGSNSYNFTNTSTNGSGTINSYTWSINGSTYTTPNVSNIFYASSGSKNITLTVTDNNNCPASITKPVFVMPKPIVNFTVPDLNQCLNGNLFTFTNNSTFSYDALTYNWNFGDGNSSTNVNPAHSFATVNTFNVGLTATSTKFGCTNTYNNNIQINAHPIVNIGINNLLLCDKKVNFKDSSSIVGGTLSAWSWDFGDGTISNAQNPQKDYNGGGNYTVTLTANSNNNCTAIGSRNISLINGPTAVIGNSNIGQCLDNNLFTFNNLSTNNHPSWMTGSKWFFGNGDTSINTFPNPYRYDAIGNYEVKLVVYSSTGCNDTAITTVSVVGKNKADFTASSPGCNQTINFNNVETSGNFYWDFGDGNTSTTVSPTHTYLTSGNFTVKLVNYSGFCLADTITKIVSVGIVPNAGFTYLQSTCSNKINFTNTSTIASGSLTSYWNFGDGSAILNEINHSKAYSISNTFIVTLTVVSNAGCSSTVSQNVLATAIGNGLNSDFTYAEESSNCVTRVNFTNISTGSLSNVWLFDDGSSTNTLNATNTYASAGLYNVKLVSLNATGCSDTTTKTINILNNSGNAVKASFTANNAIQCLSGNNFNFNNLSYTVNYGYGGTYTWDYGDGTNSTVTFVYNKKYTNPGVYLVKLYAKANYGNCMDTTSMVVVVKPSPQANYTTNIGCGSFVSFNNTTTNAVSYLWNFGDGATSTLVNPTYTYPTPGWYFSNLIATGANGCVDSIQVNVVPNASTKPTSSFTTSIQVCSNKILFTTISNANLNWDFGDGNLSSETNPEHGYSIAGNYNVKLVATNGTCSDSTTMLVVAPAIANTPIASISANIINCNNDLFVSNNSSNGNNYKIYVDGILVFSGNTPTNYSQSNLAVGAHYISAVAEDNGSCIDSITEVIMAKPAPTANYSSVSSNCEGTVSFNNTSNNAVTYKWDFGDGTISNDKNPTKSYNAPGIYNVELRAENALGCTDIFVSSVEAFMGGITPVANFISTPNNGACSNKINFTNNSSGGSLIYHWDFGDGNSSTQENPQKGYAFTGTYNVTLTVKNTEGCISSFSELVNVAPGNGPSASFYTDNVTQCITDNNFNFYNASKYMNTNSVSWIYKNYWSFGDGTFDFSNTFVYGKKYTSAGDYAVQLVVESTDGCKDTMIMNVSVSAIPCSGLVINKSITTNPNTIEIGKDAGKFTALNSIAANASIIELYPNPNNGNFTITLNKINAKQINIVVTDVLGRIQTNQTLSNNNNKIEINNLNLTEGQYIISLFTNGEVIGYKKITLTK